MNYEFIKRLDGFIKDDKYAMEYHITDDTYILIYYANYCLDFCLIEPDFKIAIVFDNLDEGYASVPLEEIEDRKSTFSDWLNKNYRIPRIIEEMYQYLKYLPPSDARDVLDVIRAKCMF